MKSYWKLIRLFVLIAFFAGIFVAAYTHYAVSRKKEEVKELIYTVEHRDSIEKIARKFKVLPWQLRLVNGLEINVILQPGQILKIPNLKWRKYEGKASWYGRAFHGKTMANGDIYDQDKISVAHRTLPFGLTIKITNLSNNSVVVATVSDRGPYVVDENGNYTREIDLSRAAAEALGAFEKGVIPVLIEPIG
ncbi:septal ring lytic transglycosylase RlpA family protein [Candidatus Wolfebacteria bacterium]|nr:septal ring lytic transglycosylase RlpA family protein [Candidatus Wolfebacteria bacterium]